MIAQSNIVIKRKKGVEHAENLEVEKTYLDRVTSLKEVVVEEILDSRYCLIRESKI